MSSPVCNGMFWDSNANIAENFLQREHVESSRVSTFALASSCFSSSSTLIPNILVHPSHSTLPHSGCHNIFGGCEMNLIRPCSFPINKLTTNTTTMTVGYYGGLYHSQSSEELFMCASGLKIIISRNSIPSLH
ncbi:uncharacterized protein HD556DRAFT_769637 [Suillus plorans]|uniref:Uncharacterized protein n=1 Tax=Suillus plorans TaxID=116603 RepID=A0A9P7AHK0_9AGAM|nr:uncharacterized protein HD556DRAFT_769637 [Suillus plorans]KAG1789606.1 hypothetical protein HD556DRAFT_769637 [Suillus plorans]